MHGVALVVVLDDFLSPEMRMRTIENKRVYAEHWNFALVAPSAEEVRDSAAGFPSAWAKLQVAKTALESYRYVFVVDGDAVIMRLDIDLGLAIAELEEVGGSMLISKDFNGLNSGVFLLKSTPWTFAFLAEASKARALLGRKTRTMPLKYENRAFFYLTGMWPECFGVRRPDALLAPTYNDTRKFRDGIHLVDRCLINRRPVHSTLLWDVLASDAGMDVSTGAFVMHVAGGTPQSKRAVLEILLEQSSVKTSNSQSI